MTFRLVVNTDNAAFQPEGDEGLDWSVGNELARILHRLADSFTAGVEAEDEDAGVLFDVNGNRCGTWTLTHDTPTPTTKRATP